MACRYRCKRFLNILFKKYTRQKWLEKVKIVASSGFNPEKCLLFANTNAPVDVIGTGSYIPNNWEETYATADIIKYGEKSLVKKGREFLIQE